MPRNKKNKGNSGPAPNNNKAKSPAETKVVKSTVTPIAAPLPVESDTSNEELKARLVNAKERLHLLQEVIGGIGDPSNVENFKASGIDAAKEKLNIIQDSVDSMKTTLLEVRQEATRSVTPEGSPTGTNKKRKNKKHQNQNPPQGFVVREEPAVNVAETKTKTDAPEEASAAVEQDDGTTTISKKKRNRNRNKSKGQQEQSPAPESLKQESNVTVEPVAVVGDEPSKVESKEIPPDANQSKNNKKNNKKSKQKSTNEKIEADTSVAAVKPADLKSPPAEVKTDNQPPTTDKNKNKKADGNNKETEKVAESPAGDQQSKVQADTNVKDSKADKPAADVSKDTKSATKTKEDSPSGKESQKKGENVKDQQPKIKNDPKKGPNDEEKPAANKQQAPAKAAEKPETAAAVEQAPKNVTDTKPSEQVVSDVSKAKNEDRNEATTTAVISKLPEKQERPEDAASVRVKVQTEPKTVLDVNKEILKAAESPKLPVAEDKTSKDKLEQQFGSIAAPTLPKLDFSQVVKDNKDKIPLWKSNLYRLYQLQQLRI